MATLNYKERAFEVNLITEGKKLVRVVLNDGGLEFPFVNYEKAAEFISAEYGGSKEEVVAALIAAQPLDGLEIGGATSAISPEKTKKTSKAKTDKPAKEKKEKVEKEKKEKTPKLEPVTMTFNVGGKEVKKTLQTKTILPDQKVESTEDVVLNEKYSLHIDIYSKKNRTSKLIETATGTAILENVSLMDVIWKFAELTDMTFNQADKYIKIKRGLLPEPEKKTKKADKTETANSDAAASTEGATVTATDAQPQTEAPAEEAKA
jgi:hypothetical protein